MHTLQVGLLLLLIHLLILHGLCKWVHQGWLVGVASHVSSTLLLLHAWSPCREGEVPLTVEENGVYIKLPILSAGKKCGFFRRIQN